MAADSTKLRDDAERWLQLTRFVSDPELAQKIADFAGELLAKADAIDAGNSKAAC